MGSHVRHSRTRWPQIGQALVTLATADGRVAQRSTTTSGQKTILAALDLPEPPKYLDFTPSTETATSD
jgi:hypothetical protein